MLYTTSYSFPRIPRPQPASLVWGLQAISELDFIKFKKWPFLQEMLKPEYLRNQKMQKRLTIPSEKITCSL